MRALVFLLLVAAASAYKMDNCDLARKLKAAGMDGVGTSLSGWVCLAFRESSYDTEAVNRANSDGSTDYGIFQINNRYWCSDSQFNGRGCGVRCTDLYNLQRSITCAKTIVREQGIHAWVGWRNGCQGDTRKYIAGCTGL
ncbi:lysozyme C II-like [Engraulis encrasicolus]|uniref:lysozyme C II-like n=1 Tax=Engraulis encrasicolus TaxID=184585 RepID=UPI002FD5DEC3